ncbi:hypothetical protein LCGC14_1509720, partial [marine sediment metagenome]
MPHDPRHTNPNESAADFEVRIAGEAGGDALEPAVAAGASKGETIILFNGFPV